MNELKNEREETCERAALAYWQFKAMFKHFPGGTEKDHEDPLSS
jgi:hypothetical protein